MKSVGARIEEITAAEAHGDDVHVEKISKEYSISNTEEKELVASMPL